MHEKSSLYGQYGDSSPTLGANVTVKVIKIVDSWPARQLGLLYWAPILIIMQWSHTIFFTFVQLYTLLRLWLHRPWVEASLTELALLSVCGECGAWCLCRARSVRARCADVSSRTPRGTAASNSRPTSTLSVPVDLPPATKRAADVLKYSQ